MACILVSNFPTFYECNRESLSCAAECGRDYQRNLLAKRSGGGGRGWGEEEYSCWEIGQTLRSELNCTLTDQSVCLR